MTHEAARIQVVIKLRPTPRQERELRRWLWHLTALWNWAIKKIEHDAHDGIYYSKYDFMRLVNGHGRQLGVPQHVLSGMAANAWVSWRRCFDRHSRAPRLKGRRNRLNSIPFTHGSDIRITGLRRVRVIGLAPVKFHKQTIPEGRIGCGRLIRRASGWYLALIIQSSVPRIEPLADGVVGIDPGFSRLLTLSTGEVINHPDELRASALRLAQATRGQRRSLAARIEERIRYRRRDRNHKLARRIVEENAVIVWSKDRIVALQRSFGKSVASAGHSQLRSMLAYKSRAGGRQFIEVDSRNSTRTCSVCGARSGPTGYAGLKVRQWACACGAIHDRDVNAAVNTLRAGLGMSLERRREAASGIATCGNTGDVHPKP